MMPMLSEIFKAYDVRGIYAKTLSEDVAFQIGKAFVTFLKAKQVIVGRDMRLSSPALSKAFMRGVIESGADTIDIGEVSTDALYFASGFLKTAAVMFTASHNPREYNGIKFCKKGALPINYDNGLRTIKKIIEKNQYKKIALKKGKIIEKNIDKEYRNHVQRFLKGTSLNKLKIAVDAGNGMAGKMIPLVYNSLDVDIVPLYFTLDGSFPNHPADPSKYENLVALQKTVIAKKCGFGMAFDGDADRVFFVDEKGKVCNSSLIASLIIKKLLSEKKGPVIHNVVCSKIVPETISKFGGTIIKERVGHSFIKETMRKNKALFGCEHSAHYYFKDNFNADSGIIASIIVASLVSESGKKLSELLDEFRKYHTIEETNSPVDDKEAKMQEIKNYYKKFNPKKIEELDGITIEFKDWWFNVRPSNTEPLLRLNLEAISETLMLKKKEEVLKLINA